MNRTILFTILTGIVISVTAIAQQAAVQKTDNVVLTTNPPGATAYFSGAYSLVVNTPAILPSNLSGTYKIRITRPGYESWKGELALLPGNSNNVNIDLIRKTRLKAGLRSLFIPGWGQYYGGSSIRGAVFTLSIIGAGAVLYESDKKYGDKRTAYDVAHQNYDNAASITQRELLRPILESARQTASKAETDRRRIFYLGVGIWVYNILDSVIFFPDESAFVPTISATDNGGAQVSMVVKF
jgi:hypothetical protein